MTKKVLRKTSNPKKSEEYLKMFERYLKFVKELEHSSSFIVDEPIGTITDVIIDSMALSKNDRIESFLKYYRACLCQRVLVHYEGTDADEFKKYCQKEVDSYKQKTEMLPNETLPDTFEMKHILSTLQHYVDLYNSDKNFWRSINNYSWANKSPSKIYYDLSMIQEELSGRKQFSIKEYERQFSRAESSEEYLKIDDKYTWYIIESNSCPFEAYLNEHCGTDRSADVLFSLRSKDKQGYFDSHVTISASIKSIDKEKFGTPAVFIVKQVKGKGNDTPNVRYWPAIVKLFLENEFGWQEQGSYRPEADFHISDLDDKDKEKFLKVKPWWDDIFKALHHYELFKDEKHFTAKNWGAKEVRFDDKGSFIIQYHSFGEMIDELSKHWVGPRRANRHADNIIDQAKYYIDDYHPDIDYKIKDIPFDDFFLWIKNKQKGHYNNIVDCMEAEGLTEISELAEYDPDAFGSLEDDCKGYLRQVKNAFELAYRDGLEVGTRNEAYKKFKDYFDGLEFNYEGSHAGSFTENNDGTFDVIIFHEALVEYYNETGNFDVPTPDTDSLEPPRKGVEWDTEFDDEIAAEVLFENLPD